MWEKVEGEEVTKSLNFYGKHWLLPDGRCVDVSADEHARYARAAMLNIDGDDIQREIPLNTIFKPLTKDETLRHLERGVCADAVGFLCADDEIVDPRVYMIRKGWVRQASADFYAWRWGEAALDNLSRADEFWKSQKNVTPKSWAVLWNVADSNYMAGTLESLLPRFAEKKP